MENTGKYDFQPSTFRLVISIIEVICLNISFLLVYQVTLVKSGLKISLNKDLPCITKINGIYGKIFNFH